MSRPLEKPGLDESADRGEHDLAPHSELSYEGVRSGIASACLDVEVREDGGTDETISLGKISNYG